MKTTKKIRTKGVIVYPDDLEIGQFYAVYGLKNGTEQPVQIAGQSFRLIAMNLPFLIGKVVCDPAHAPVTFDARFLTLMKVSDEYVQAQRPDPAGVPAPDDLI